MLSFIITGQGFFFFLPLLPTQFYKYYQISKAFCRGKKTQIRKKLKNQDLWIHLLIYMWGTIPGTIEANSDLKEIKFRSI